MVPVTRWQLRLLAGVVGVVLYLVALVAWAADARPDAVRGATYTAEEICAALLAEDPEQLARWLADRNDMPIARARRIVATATTTACGPALDLRVGDQERVVGQ